MTIKEFIKDPLEMEISDLFFIIILLLPSMIIVIFGSYQLLKLALGGR